MLVDNRSKDLSSYGYSLIQFHNDLTNERFNIGLVINNDDQYYIHLPRKFDKLSGCIGFDEISGLNYTLDVIEDRIKNQNRLTIGKVSNAIFITEELYTKANKNPDIALQEIVNKFIMIQKLRTLDQIAHTDKYDKRSIIKLMNQYAKEKEINNFVAHRSFDISRKLIDMALVNKEDIPYSIASITSPHIEHFDDSIITNIFTLEEARRNGKVSNMFLYTPVFPDIKSKKLGDNIGWAKEQAQHYKLDLITDHREEVAMERLLS